MENTFEKFSNMNMFNNPFEIMEAFKNVADNSDKIIENNIKYRRACIAYNQAILDMTEAINDNMKLMSKKE